MAISTKMIESKAFKDSQAQLEYMYALLEQQLGFIAKLMKENDELRKKGYQQYRTYAHNNRKDKITWIPCNAVQLHEVYGLLSAIRRFFEWQREFKSKGCF